MQLNSLLFPTQVIYFEKLLHFIVLPMLIFYFFPLFCTLFPFLSVARQKETVIPTELPLVHEVTTTLREWATIWRDLYVVTLHFAIYPKTWLYISKVANYSSTHLKVCSFPLHKECIVLNDGDRR